LINCFFCTELKIFYDIKQTFSNNGGRIGRMLRANEKKQEKQKFEVLLSCMHVTKWIKMLRSGVNDNRSFNSRNEIPKGYHYLQESFI
jgi:hypothetical protein